MDSFEFNKYFGAATGAFMVYLAVTFVTEGVFAPAHHGGHGAHGDEPKLAFAMAIEESSDDSAEDAAPEVPLGALVAEADLGAGERVFKKCGSCHDAEPGGPNKVGPALYGVVGRDIGGHEGFGYSDVLASMEGDWTWEHLDAFLANPKDFAPGTKMSFAGLKKPEDRANLMAWLNQKSDSPLPPPPVEAAAGDAAEGAATEAETEAAH